MPSANERRRPDDIAVIVQEAFVEETPRFFPQCIRIVDGDQVLAVHRDRFDRGEQIEDPRDIQALFENAAARGQNQRPVTPALNRLPDD